MRLFLILLITSLLLIFLSLFAFFSLQFDPDQMRPQIEAYLSRATHARAQLGNVSMPKSLPVGLQIEDLTLTDTDGGLLLKSPRATLRFSAFKGIKFLRQRKIEVEEMMIEEPQIYVRRSSEGLWNWTTRSAVKPEEKAASDAQVSISMITFKGAKIFYFDKSRNPGFSTVLQPVSAQIGLSGDSGEFSMQSRGSLAAFPETSRFLFDGRWDPKSRKCALNLSYQNNALLQGELSFEDEVRFAGRLTAKGLDLNTLIPERWKRQEYFTGTLTASFEGTVEGSHPEQLKKTLTLTGAIDLRNGAIKNQNFIHDVLVNLAPIPGFSRILDPPIPEKYRLTLTGNDTPFEILQATVQILQGRIYSEEIRLKSPWYQIEANGNAGILQKDVDFRAQLVLLEEMSAYLTGKAEEFQVMLTPQGRIAIPFAYKGLLPAASVYPDLHYISDELLRYRAEAIASQGMEKIKELTEVKK